MQEREQVSLFGTLLRGRIADVGLKVHGVAVEAGISPPNLYNILTGKRSPSDPEIEKLASVKRLDLPQNVLRAWADADKMGKERLENAWKILKEIDPTSPVAVNEGKKRQVYEYLKTEIEGIEPKGRKGLDVGDLIHIATGISPAQEPLKKTIPLAGAVGCGRKLDLEPTDTIELPADVASRGDYAVRAEGDSMNKLIADGDILIVKSKRTAKEGQVVVANIHHDGSTCKRLRKFGKLTMLMPESYNPEHMPEPVTEDISIIGVVTYIHRPGIPLE